MIKKMKRQHKGAVLAARQKHLRFKLENGEITKEEYEFASKGKVRHDTIKRK